MNYLDLTLVEIHDALVAKKVTPLELTKEAINRLKANKDNALEADMFSSALEEAAKLLEPEVDNPFWGVPILVKDNFSTKGVETTGSSNILKGYIPVYDATVVKKLKDAKAIIIGKTTLDELAIGGNGTKGHLGVTYNPWDPSHQRIIGGSSCGSATVVADAIVPFALGSDTGDSVRKPASYGGLVGFKPTWSRISRYGLFSFSPSLDNVGYFTRSVEDAAVSLKLLAGYDTHDMSSSTKPVENYLENLHKGVKGVRIAVISNLLALADPVLINLIEENLAKLAKAGAIINRVNIDEKIFKAILPTYYILSCAEATSCNATLDGLKFGYQPDGKTYEEIMIKARSTGLGFQVKQRFMIGAFVLARENHEAYYEQAQKARRVIVNAYNEVFKDNDIIYLPGAPSVAPYITDLDKPQSEEYIAIDNHLGIGNLGGYPSLSLPIGFKDELPLGINLMTKPFDEMTIFQVGNEIEKLTGLKNLSAKRGAK